MKTFYLPAYLKAVKKLLKEEERDAMEISLAIDPLAHPVIPRTGGFRKARWSRGSSGKRGGVRVIYYYFVTGQAIYLTSIYAKNAKENLSHEQENQLRHLAQEIEHGEA